MSVVLFNRIAGATFALMGLGSMLGLAVYVCDGVRVIRKWRSKR